MTDDIPSEDLNVAVRQNPPYLLRMYNSSSQLELSPLRDSLKQYSFRLRRSTIDATRKTIEAVRKAKDYNQFLQRVVLLVTLYVKNAFNSAR